MYKNKMELIAKKIVATKTFQLLRIGIAMYFLIKFLDLMFNQKIFVGCFW
jgi:hypothetical protein